MKICTKLLLIAAIVLLSFSSVNSFQIFGPLKQSWHISNLQRSTKQQVNEVHSRRETSLYAIKGPVRYSSNQWIECLTTLPTSRVLKRTKGQLAALTVWTTLLTWLSKTGRMTCSLPISVHSILGSALSLLLVFRTNSSYDRFWEGRKQWGTVIRASRDLARSFRLYIPKQYHERLCKLLLAYSMVLKQHLQGERINEELEPYLESEELPRIQKLRNRPMYLLILIHELIYKGVNEKYPDPIRSTAHEASMEHTLQDMGGAATACERIVKQPVPMAYTRHLSRFLSFYLLTLPLTLIPSLGWATIPTMGLVSWAFISIKELGTFIEEPFDKHTTLIAIPQLVYAIRSKINETFEGEILSSPDMEAIDIKLNEEARLRSRRSGDDTFFAYY